MNAVTKKNRKSLEKLNSIKFKTRSNYEPSNDDHETCKKVTYKTKYGGLPFDVSENGERLGTEYKDFMSPSSVSMELGLEYIEREKSIIKLCELINPAQIYIKQGQETCKGGYKKCGWWLVIDDEKNSFVYRKGEHIEYEKVIS